MVLKIEGVVEVVFVLSNDGIETCGSGVDEYEGLGDCFV